MFRILTSACLALILGGCLLPQPDTPPIGPPNITSPVSAPAPDDARIALGGLRVRTVGFTAARVIATPEAPGALSAVTTPGPDGAFALDVPPGRYALQVEVDGALVRVEGTLAAPGAYTLTRLDGVVTATSP